MAVNDYNYLNSCSCLWGRAWSNSLSTILEVGLQEVVSRYDGV